LAFQLVRNQFLISTIGLKWFKKIIFTSSNSIVDNIKNYIFN